VNIKIPQSGARNQLKVVATEVFGPNAQSALIDSGDSQANTDEELTGRFYVCAAACWRHAVVRPSLIRSGSGIGCLRVAQTLVDRIANRP
jgi:hypothetical protein